MHHTTDQHHCSANTPVCSPARYDRPSFGVLRREERLSVMPLTRSGCCGKAMATPFSARFDKPDTLADIRRLTRVHPDPVIVL
ncbi:hypothetical protein ALP96_200082 [Pseudomonas savastanoi pv. glycinea]|nr:hypothetical protein ALQ75_200108 [Pseudomonas savastanoi pv. glycinea]RMQ83384.1 hypothetical protein ALP96_200082 [Pseudomonas savastanoi pv. glycinea]RMQ88947.1 hypothetical protein ALP95_200007 [Pseudomonas savastanoi pv. glycinea]